MSSRWINLFQTLLLAGFVSLDQAAPLSFNTALDIAEHQSPGIASNEALIRATQSAVIPASALPDPKLVAGVDNYPVSGTEAGRFTSDPMTMQRFGVMQEVPNANKRQARNEVALANVEVAEAQRRVARLKVRREAAVAWINRYYLERKLSLFDELARENQMLADVIKAQTASGRGPVADAVLSGQEAVQLADRRDDLSRDLAKARAALRRLVGGDADESLAGSPPVLNINGDQLQQHLHQHPELRAFEAETRRAEAQVREVDSTKHSDWSVELDYQRRAPQFGDMVSIQFTFDLPISPSTRQDPLIAAKQQELSRIDADREGMLRDHANELANELADYAALASQLERAHQTALPLAQEKVELLTASYKTSKVDLSAVLAARRDLIDQRLKIIDLENQRASMAAQLYFAYEESLQ